MCIVESCMVGYVIKHKTQHLGRNGCGSDLILFFDIFNLVMYSQNANHGRVCVIFVLWNGLI